jgi:hypothetical protein
MIKIIFFKKTKIINFLIILVLQSCNSDSSLSKYPTKHSNPEDFSKKKEISNESVDNNNDDKNKKKDKKKITTNIKNAKVYKRYEDPKFDGYESSPNETLRGILVGSSGSGKINIFEKITNKEVSIENIIRNLFLREKTAYYNKFEITYMTDQTLGLGNIFFEYKGEDYNDVLRKSISSIPLNTIFVVIDSCLLNLDSVYESESVLDYYKYISKSFKESDEFDKKAVLILNNTDEYSKKDLEEDIKIEDSNRKKIIEKFSSEGFQNQIIFCSAIGSDPKDIFDAMYQCVSRMKPYTINLTESEGMKELKKISIHESKKRSEYLKNYIK